jgi:hypothetical protein
MKNRVELRNYIRFQLTQLGATNGAHAFEQLCFELARLRHVRNLLPATGPVQSGGDQGRDFESYRTFLARSSIATSSFAARASQDLVVGACTLERNNLPAKIKRDLKTMFGAGEKPAQVIYFCQVDLPVAQRHKLQTHCRDTYNAALEIYDGQAIADQLADPDTFWIAGQYLAIPADFYPEEAPDEDYAKLKSRWLVEDAEPPLGYADFLDVKLGLRTATFEETVRQDLERWIALMRGFEAHVPSRRLRQKTRYEIAVAELRGRGNLDPARNLVEAFFEELSKDESRAVDLLDAAVLSVYGWGAVLHQQTTIDLKQVEAWARQVADLVDAAEKGTNRRGERCTLLEAKAMLAGLTAITEGPEAALAHVLAAWTAVLKLVEETPQYPIAHIAELVDRFAPFFAGQVGFRPLRDRIEELVEARSGQHAVAARSYRRALAQFEAGNRLAAIDELQKAKRGWFSGDEMAKSVMAMLLLAEGYAALNLHAAARYYAAGAAYIAVNSDDEDIHALTPLASLKLADSFLGAGEGMSFLKAFFGALQVFGVLTPNAEGPARNEIDDGLAKAAIFVHVARRLAPELKADIDHLLESLPVARDEFEAHVQMAGAADSAWGLDDLAALEEQVASAFGVSPFADLGETREIVWAALGIQWKVTSSADPDTWAAALSLAAILQILQVELADAELLIIPTTATLEVSLGDVRRPQVRESRSEHLGWEVMMPRAPSPNDDGLSDAVGVVATVLGEASVMSEKQFKAAFGGAFERELTYRANSVRPAREMMAFAQEQLGEEAARLRALPPQPLASAATPREPAELAWPTTPGPGYSKAKALEALANRYRRPFEMAGPTLRRVLADERVRDLLLEVRAEGYRDWQILGAVLSMVLQFQAEAGLKNPRDIGALREAFRLRGLREEQPDDPVFDPATITAESLEASLFSSVAACLNTWGLRLNRMSLDPKGVRRLLDVRYGQAEDDIPHDDILAA